jgi:2-dehydro-3-deoxyphosphogluconate aldolase/(4S)-4-hydroxy-2-oxoglutarate aldolase
MIIIGILRGFTTDVALQIADAAARGGLEFLEITMNSPGATDQIRELRQLGSSLKIGAGTVLSLQDLDQAQVAGAEFIVTPVMRPEVIHECVRRKLPVYPGAFSPTEILTAWELGATMVKVFPAETLGPGYIRALKGPFPQIKLLPTGGVDLKTLPEFKKAGACGAGVGSPLFDRKRIEAKDWPWLEARCRAFKIASENAT